MQPCCCSFIHCSHVSSDPCSQVGSFFQHALLTSQLFQNHDQHLRGHHYQLSAEMPRQQQGVPQDLVPLHPLPYQPPHGGQRLSEPPHILVCWHSFQSSSLKISASVQDNQAMLQL